MFVFDAAACAAVWALLLVGFAMPSGDSPGALPSVYPGTIAFGGGFIAGAIGGGVALRRLTEERQVRVLYVIVFVFALGMGLLHLASRSGFGAF